MMNLQKRAAEKCTGAPEYEIQEDIYRPRPDKDRKRREKSPCEMKETKKENKVNLEIYKGRLVSRKKEQQKDSQM